MKKILAILIAVVVGACSATNITNEISNLLNREMTYYGVVAQSSRGQLRGEVVAENLQSWASSLASLNNSVKNLSDRLQSHPDEWDNVSDEVRGQMKTRFDELFSRNDNLMILIPSWRMNDAAQSQSSIMASLSSLRSRYRQMYNQTPPSGSNNLQLMVDARLYDTYQDCVNAFTIFGLARNDNSCSQIAQRVCGHQMKLMSCLTTMFLNAAANGTSCSVTRCDQNGNCSEDRAPWISQVANCNSTTPVEGPAE